MLSDTTKIFGISGFSLLVFSIIQFNIILPQVRKSQINKKIILKSGSLRRETWNQFPHSFECRAYVFNVTNPKEIANGEKPIVHEIGPFVYESLNLLSVWQDKIKQIDHEEDDTLSYMAKRIYHFNSKKSKGLSDEDELTIPHLLSLGTSNGVMKDKAIFLTIASRAIDSVLQTPESVFVKEKIKTLLFNGFEIDCRNPEDWYGQAFCADIKDSWQEHLLIKKADNFYTTSIWGTLNATDVWLDNYRIRRGIRNISQVGEFVEVNNKKNLSTWKNDYCDAFSGTDGTLFRPYLDKKASDKLYVTDAHFCRKLLYHYESEVKFSGMKLIRYTTTMGTNMETNPQDQCFCIGPDRCLKDGVFELFRCLGTPLIVSNPHFYLADPYYINSVKGASPNKEKHVSTIDIDPLTGTVISTRLRIQYSLFLMKLEKYRLVENFPEALLPIMWSEEVFVLPDSLIKEVKSIHKMITLMKVIGYITMFTGLTLCGYSGYLKYIKLNKKGEVEHITPAEDNQNGKGKVELIRVGEIRPAPVPPNIDY